MTPKILVYGAGAIGRGYIPWIFNPEHFNIIYVEANSELRNSLNMRGEFTTYCTKDGSYAYRRVAVDRVYAPGEELMEVADSKAIITAVGPRNVLDMVPVLSEARCPIILFENDDSLAEVLQQILPDQTVCFGVPDVITSNTAPAELLAKDPLAVVTEDGVSFIDERAASVGGECRYVSQYELHRQWLAKLYVHNTPHCIAAYLGALCSGKYLHEAMQIAEVYSIVQGSMLEMREMLIQRFGLDSTFVNWYAEKELKRFSNELLFDPLVRVAREPFRKLARDNRLIGAAQLALTCGIVPHNLIKGIISACLYDEKNDPDFNITHLVRALTPDQFLRLVLKLHPDEALFRLLSERWDDNVVALKRISAQ